MKLLLSFLLLFSMQSCDCLIERSGFVYDYETHLPIAGVAFGEKNIEGKFPEYQKTDKDGSFEFTKVSGGICKCPDVVLEFSKEGYLPLLSFQKKDTIYLQKIKRNNDSSIIISKSDFDKLVEKCFQLLNTKPLNEISDENHVAIMMCLNTIFFNSVIDKPKYDKYKGLEKLARDKNYGNYIQVGGRSSLCYFFFYFRE